MCLPQLFRTSGLAKGILFHNFSLGKGMLFGMVKEMSNFGNSCIEIQNFDEFDLEKAKIWQFLSRGRQLTAH